MSTTVLKDGEVQEQQVSHIEASGDVDAIGKATAAESDRRPEAQGKDQTELPKGYFYSPYFIGSYCAIGLAFACGTGGFALVAPILSEISRDLGAYGSSNVNWVGIVYSLAQAVVLMLAGRLSDIFGRRWFFIIGSSIGLIGSIVAGTSTSLEQLIAGETLIGIAAGFQCSFFWVVAEIVPMKRRFIANAGLFLFTLPTNNTSVKWRGCFYYLTALNTVSVLLWFLFYHPPTFNMLHRTKRAKQLILGFDFVGLLLFSAGMILLLMGLNWGGSLYPWKSGYVLGTLLSGFVTLVVCVVYELRMSLEEPYLPLELFKNIKYTSCVIWCSIEAMTFYAFGLIWPNAVPILYPNLDPDSRATISGLVTMSFVLGQMTGPFFANWLPAKPLVIIGSFIGTGLLAAVAANPLNLDLTLGLLVTGNLIIGMADGIGLPMTTFPIKNQERLGTAGGLSGCIRLAGTSIAVAMYSTILSNRLSQTIPAAIETAALSTGISESAVPELITALKDGRSLYNVTVKGLTASAIPLIEQAYRTGNARAYSTVFLSTLGFGGVALVLSFFIGGVDESDGEYVAAMIQNTNESALVKVSEKDQHEV
ncbi:fungal trichothecene efflux pump [Talaromyces proteolyticus]|uniref:Fungal trichothecene efflux pump n=1 Tax=Talaromyces proteolyticus TaxID=1131652 RepID=A0AAD4KJ59_9EURO|nr:fungal trichothecene efflux pump [Talaromyces proteolyticus]KAH8691503.1 fungal trichothecene efflux pump [Talaromyces proteolyticus]